MPDILAALIDYLKQQTGITDLTGSSNIYGMELSGAIVSQLPNAFAVLVRPSGGLMNYQSSRLNYNQRVDIRCYAPTAKQSNDLQRACIDALNNLEMSLNKSAMLYSASMESGINFAREPNPANWLFTFTVWTIASNTRSFQAGYIG